MEKQTVTLHIRVSDKTAITLKRLAEADRRKLATYIGIVLDEHVARAEQKAAKSKRGGK